jgi:hypothetical protein
VYVSSQRPVRQKKKGRGAYQRYPHFRFDRKNHRAGKYKGSGLLLPPFTREDFNACFELADGVVTLTHAAVGERLAQILADVPRKKLVSAKKKFSFETVFSHPSKLEIMRET